MNEQAHPDEPLDAPRGPGRRPRRLVAVLAAVALAGSGALIAVERATRPQPPAEPSPTATSSASSPFGPYPRFAPDSAYAVTLENAPTHPRSPALVARLARDVRDNWGGVAAFNVGKFAAGYAVATPQTPRRDVAFADCQHKGAPPAGLYDGPAYFRSVPIPDDAVQGSGSDGHLAVFDPARDALWEFWVAKRRGDGTWEACWGGRIDEVSRSRGQFAAPYGASASGLATAGYMVSMEDVRRGEIDHAVGLVVMTAGVGHSYPANRDDGNSTAPDALKEGTRLRLDPGLDLTSLGLSPIGRMVARAAQTHGFVVVDKGGAVAVMAESGDRDARREGRNPWSTLRAGSPEGRELSGFPWERLQVVEEGWGRPEGS